MSHTTVVTCGGAVQMCHNCSPGVENFVKNVRTLSKNDDKAYSKATKIFRLFRLFTSSEVIEL